MTVGLRNAEGALAVIEGLADAGLSAEELITQAARRIDAVVPSDGFFIVATDPATTLSIGTGVLRDLPKSQCVPTWDYEFLVPDYLKFADIGFSGAQVADLHAATGGRPDRSARWREYGAATGFRSELRAAFTVGGAVWAIGQFDRHGDSPRYTEEERAWLARVAPVVARGVRRALLTRPDPPAGRRGPGLVLLDDAGGVESVTREASGWLEEMDSVSRLPTRAGVPVPIEVLAYAAHVRGEAARTATSEIGPARMRARSGVWLLMHASMLEDGDRMAVIIEPATATDVAPLIVEAYGLTPRELDVTRAIARGLGTSQIAAALHLSPHTVRDYVKSTFEKVGVSSRGELVAKVFADHYAPPPPPPRGDDPSPGPGDAPARRREPALGRS
jgi:DNA-binding CsgD family transcriptional regulator